MHQVHPISYQKPVLMLKIQDNLLPEIMYTGHRLNRTKTNQKKYTLANQ